MSWFFFLSSLVLLVYVVWQNAFELRFSVCACMCLVWRMSLLCSTPVNTKPWLGAMLVLLDGHGRAAELLETLPSERKLPY